MKHSMALVLAWVAGFADAATFIYANGFFCSHITGNVVLFAAAFYRGLTPADYLKLMALPVALVATSAATLLHRLALHWSVNPVRLLLLVESALLVSCGIATDFVGGQGLLLELVSFESVLLMTAVFAMGLQNALHRLEPDVAPTTTTMTGNLTKLSVETSQVAIETAKGNSAEKHKSRAWQTVRLILSFTFGCAVSAVVTTHWGLKSLCLPGALLLGYSSWVNLPHEAEIEF